MDDTRHPESFSAKLVAFGREYRLEATRHDELLHPDYGEYVIESDGSLHRVESTTSRDDHCHYRGVIVGYDKTCQQSEAWIRSMGVDSLTHGRNQPFYHVLADTHTALALDDASIVIVRVAAPQGDDVRQGLPVA